jgi:hypothetical protein
LNADRRAKEMVSQRSGERENISRDLERLIQGEVLFDELS